MYIGLAGCLLPLPVMMWEPWDLIAFASVAIAARFPSCSAEFTYLLLFDDQTRCRGILDYAFVKLSQ